MEYITETYLKAFNNGYLLAKHKPKLLDILLQTKSENEYLLGLKDGKKTFDLEKNKSKRLNELEQLQSRNSKDQELGR